jgi:prolyl-tRNA synthetase
MLYSKVFGKTTKNISESEVSINAQLLTRGGFVNKSASGVYTILPLGKIVLDKISQIVREEMNAAGGQEVTMPVLQPKENWEKTGRWESLDVLYKVKDTSGKEMALGPTHEEIVTPLVRSYLNSYKQLPIYLYQIQTKFRDEPRAKSGLLRGREFLMKDMYSFHADSKDFTAYYEKMKKVYLNTFKRLGLAAIETEASGGSFSKFSHEYQVITKNGEDEIIYCKGGDFAQNTEIATVPEGKMCDLGHGPLEKVKTIEVGNIFDLKTKFSDAFDLRFTDSSGIEHPVLMGCYGIGISRVMAAIVEVYNDEGGILWPESVAPFEYHLVNIGANKEAGELYEKMVKSGKEVLWDDREESAGVKLSDADLLGIPTRLIISDKSLKEDSVEIKKRDSVESRLEKITKIL